MYNCCYLNLIKIGLLNEKEENEEDSPKNSVTRGSKYTLRAKRIIQQTTGNDVW